MFACTLRLIANSKVKCVERKKSSNEVQAVTQCIISIVQQVNFNEQIQCLEAGKELPTNSNIICLCPFSDVDKILRVEGALKNTQLSENQKHPIILSSKNNVSKIKIKHFHEKYFCVSPELLFLIR